MSKSNLTKPSEILFYKTEDGSSRIEVRLEGETVWLSLNQLSELFQRDKSVISKHIDNIFEEGELHPGATVAKYATVQQEGALLPTNKVGSNSTTHGELPPNDTKHTTILHSSITPPLLHFQTAILNPKS